MFKKFLFFSLVTFVLALALEVRAFSLSPVRQLITISPGAEQIVFLQIKNNEKENKNYNLLVFGARQDNEGYPVFANGINEAEAWVKPEIDFMGLRAGEERTVGFEIQVPATAYPGSYYLGLAVQERNLEDEVIGLSGRLVSILYLQVAGEAKEELQITRWSKLSAEAGKLNFSLQFKNKGNVEVPVTGLFLIKNWQGEIQQEETIYLGNNLLAQTDREIIITVPDLEKNLPGIYRAEIIINYGRSNQVVSQTTTLLNFPWWLGLGFILFLFLLIFAITVVRRGKYVENK